MEIIVTHQNADFDAVASMLGASMLYPDATPILPQRINRNVSEFMALYRNGLPFINDDEHEITDIQRIIITDSQLSPTLETLLKTNKAIDTYIIEHHTLKRELKAYENFHYEDLGAITTWLVEQIRDKNISITSLEATLLALGIYEDTGMLTYGRTTIRDVQAVSWLLQQGAVLDTIRRFLSHPLDDAQQALFEQLLDQVMTQTIHGYHISIATAEADHVVSGINSVASRLRDIIDPTGLFVLVKMPHGIQLVCRSTHDAVDVGAVAKQFKGGGHPRAAAATIYKMPLQQVIQSIWNTLYQIVQPATRIADLMSYGIQTVHVDARISDIIQHIRRIGHEGYPVVDDDEQIVGLLTLRDADRAIEHQLEAVEVREVMRAGQIKLSQDDSVYQLEQTMVKSGWGQLPVIDTNGKPIGIVTRTDLINHWASIHPNDISNPPTQEIHFAEVFGDHTQTLLDQLTARAHHQNIAIYMVGGCVRDLLLKRPNYDIDFVVEGDAINFAKTLKEHFGGRIHAYTPFGTAKWYLDDDVKGNLGISAHDLPDHIDFATARSELYTHPTALPTVYNSGIKLDLRRRDFTINTLAIQLSPSGYHGRLHDYYGGINDLESRLIRVLHSLSFIDDPTRILRAIRFSERLAFAIEIRTMELIQAALPMLGRITGERLYNELTLLHNEENAKRGWQKLEALGILKAIHPGLHFNEITLQYWKKYENAQQTLDQPLAIEPTHARWAMIIASIDIDHVPSVCERLLLGKRLAKEFYDTAYLLQKASFLREPTTPDEHIPPSTITNTLNAMDDTSWRMALLLMQGTYGGEILQLYAQKWRYLQPFTNGHTLKTMGIPAGPIYRRVLDILRSAWLDGKITNREQEDALLKQLLDE